MRVDAPPNDLEEAQARAKVRSRIFGEPIEPIRIGRFVLLDRIGSGAAGVVYAAFDPELDRKVAVKILRSGTPDATRATTKLLAEAKAMAKLAHPNVVAVHEVGTFDGGTFIAMELVDGTTLRTWLETEERSADDILRVLIEAGRGLRAAHDAALLHGDFKPDNVLIDSSSRVRVVDFGLARPFDAMGPVAEHGAVTKSSVAGTPAYMAPEQFDGRNDTRADQFSFCVTAHEALYGARPFTASTWEELRDNIRAGKLNTTPLQSTGPRRVRTAILRGLSADPDDRFASMDQLLDALDRPRPTGKILAAGSIGVCAMGALLVMSIGDANRCTEPTVERLWNGDRRIAIERAILGTDASYAAAVLKNVVAAFDRQTRDWRTMTKDACEATHVRHEQSAAVLSTRMLCLEERAQEMRALADGLEATDSDSIGRVTNALTMLTPVSVCADLAYLKQRIPPPSDPTLREAVRAIEKQIVEVRTLYVLSRFDEGLVKARDAYRRAAELEHKPLLASAATRLGWFEAQTSNLEDAERHLHEGARFGLASGNILAMAEAWDMLTYVTSKRHSHETALRLGRYAVALAPLIVGRPQAVGAIYGRHGWLLAQMGRPHDALEFQERGMEIRRTGLGPEHPETGYSHFYMAQSLLYVGRYAEADAQFHRAETIFRAAFGEQHIMVIRSLHDRGMTISKRGDSARGRAMIERALARYIERSGPDDVSTAYARLDLARIDITTKDTERARPLVTEAVHQFLAARGEDNLEYGEALAVDGRLLLLEGRTTEALETLRRALAIVTSSLGSEEDTYRHVECIEALGTAELQAGHDDVAAPLLKRALRVYDRQFGPTHPIVRPVLEHLVDIERRLGHAEAARKYSERLQGSQAP